MTYFVIFPARNLLLSYRSIQNCCPRNSILFELIRRGVIYYAVIIVLELNLRGNSAAAYVERPRLGASGVNNDVEKDTTPYKSLRALRARSPPRSARESVPGKRGVPSDNVVPQAPRVSL